MKKPASGNRISGTVGGLLFALGICMIMVWNRMLLSIIVGIVLLLMLIPMCVGLK